MQIKTFGHFMIFKILFLVLRYLFAVVLVYMGASHFFHPNSYTPFVPSFLGHEIYVVYISGFLQTILGLLLFSAGKTAKISAFFAVLLMVAYLPIRINDCLASEPVVGNFELACYILAGQIALVFISYRIYRRL